MSRRARTSVGVGARNSQAAEKAVARTQPAVVGQLPTANCHLLTACFGSKQDTKQGVPMTAKGV